MLVMCVKKDAAESPHPDLIKAVNDIQIGSIYTVVDTMPGKYELLEFPHPLTMWWNANCFATLPNSTADEMAEVVHEAIANLETVLV